MVFHAHVFLLLAFMFPFISFPSSRTKPFQEEKSFSRLSSIRGSLVFFLFNNFKQLSFYQRYSVWVSLNNVALMALLIDTSGTNHFLSHLGLHLESSPWKVGDVFFLVLLAASWDLQLLRVYLVGLQGHPHSQTQPPCCVGVDVGLEERAWAWEPSGLTQVKVPASPGALWPWAHYSVLLNDDKPQGTVGFTCESENSSKPSIEIET